MNTSTWRQPRCIRLLVQAFIGETLTTLTYKPFSTAQISHYRCVWQDWSNNHPFFRNSNNKVKHEKMSEPNANQPGGAARFGNFPDYYRFNLASERIKILNTVAAAKLCGLQKATVNALDIGCNSGVNNYICACLTIFYTPCSSSCFEFIWSVICVCIHQNWKFK